MHSINLVYPCGSIVPIQVKFALHMQVSGPRHMAGSNGFVRGSLAQKPFAPGHARAFLQSRMLSSPHPHPGLH